MSNNHLLLVCADSLESRLLALALEQAGLTVTAVAAPENVRSLQPDLIVLVNHDGRYLATARALRQQLSVPLLLLTDYQTEDEHISALQEDVDLILFRPYSIRFLAAQIPALLRRFAPADTPDSRPPPNDPQDIVSGNLRLEANTQTLHCAGSKPTRLSRLEFRFLQTLMSHPRQTIPTETLVERVYGYDGDENGELVRKLVSRLRSKLKDSGCEPCFIHTIPYLGYSFQEGGNGNGYPSAPCQPGKNVPEMVSRLPGPYYTC